MVHPVSQDLSVAGKREGLAGERSGLFMEQIRIIKEMRDESKRTNTGTDQPVRPRYMVWENVSGAFSSNKGEDFRAVLEETAKIADKDAVIPRPEGGVGDRVDLSWETDGLSLGVYMMRNIGAYLKDASGYVLSLTLMENPQEIYSLNCGEKPSVEIPSKLSEILEISPDSKYNLSPRACQGILNRAKKREKKLPKLLERTLIRQSMMSESAVMEQKTGAPMLMKPISAEILTQGGYPDSNHGGLAIIKYGD